MAKTLVLFIGGLAFLLDSGFARGVHSTGSYPSYPTGKYPSYPTGKYPSYPTGKYPSYPTGKYPSYPTGKYPIYPTVRYPTGPYYPTGGPGKNNTNLCAINPCMNGGKCYSYRYGGWSCRCTYGFSGHKCQYSYTDPCKKSSNPCKNNGVCKSRKAYYYGRYELSCICPKTYIGPNCAVQSPCTENPCKNGNCITYQNGTNYMARCKCNGGFEGKVCDIPTPVLCNADTCKNNGLCHQYLNHTLMISQFKCYCKGNWGGKDCSKDISNPCQESPCQNEGVCTNGVKGAFACTCKNGFQGTKCEIIDPCRDETCNGHGKCMPTTQYNNGTMEVVAACMCNPNYAGQKCEITNPCIASNPCVNGGKCYSYAKRSYYNRYASCNHGSYNTTGFSEPQCHCANIFGGKTCEVVSPCVENNPCQNGGFCKDMIHYVYRNHTSIKEFKTPYCSCPPDYTGKNCETKIIDPCENDPCQNGGICSRGKKVNTFVCTCMTGYIGDMCEEKDSKIAECSFEKSLCEGFKTEGQGSYKWIINSGSTRSQRTGPSKAQDGRYYIYTEASSPARQGYKAEIVSDFFTTETESCISFYYHMLGSAIGTLKVTVEDAEGNEGAQFSISGPQEDEWIEKMLTVEPGTSRLVIQGIRGNSWAGDIAIDNIVWKGAPCKNSEEDGPATPDTDEVDV